MDDNKLKNESAEHPSGENADEAKAHLEESPTNVVEDTNTTVEDDSHCIEGPLTSGAKVLEPLLTLENIGKEFPMNDGTTFIALKELSLTIKDIKGKPQIIQEMYDLYTGINGKNYREYYHDVLERRDEMFSLFNLGYLSLEDRGLGQELFWGVCERAIKFAKLAKHMPEEFEDVERMLSRKFICNFSVFQSVPDSWAIDQPRTSVDPRTHRSSVRLFTRGGSGIVSPRPLDITRRSGREFRPCEAAGAPDWTGEARPCSGSSAGPR